MEPFIMKTKKTSPNIGILGVGQLGSRYVQGLLSGLDPLNIWLRDPAINSKSAFDLWKETYSINPGFHTLRFSSSDHEAPDHLDLVISATTADVRYESLRSFLDLKTHEYMILEKVLTTNLSDLSGLTDLVQKGKDCWVNHPKRLWPIYRQLKSQLKNLGPLQFTVEGTDWNLASNSVHFCDLVKWITGEDLVNLDCSLIDNEWRGAKRPGFVEFTGTLKYRFSQGSELTLNSKQTQANVSVSPITLTISTALGYAIVEDEIGTAQGSLLNGELKGGALLQSELTSELVSEILGTGKCGLPRFAEVAEDHIIYLAELMAHQQRAHNNFSQTIPIT